MILFQRLLQQLRQQKRKFIIVTLCLHATDLRALAQAITRDIFQSNPGVAWDDGEELIVQNWCFECCGCVNTCVDMDMDKSCGVSRREEVWHQNTNTNQVRDHLRHAQWCRWRRPKDC